MKTLLVSGKDPVPPDLREVVERGSTSLDEVSIGDLRTFVSREGLGVDRIVFWAGKSDPDVRTVAWNYATVAGADRPSQVVFISGAPAEAPLDGISAEELLIWPRDKDKVVMIFMTGG